MWKLPLPFLTIFILIIVICRAQQDFLQKLYFSSETSGPNLKTSIQSQFPNSYNTSHSQPNINSRIYIDEDQVCKSIIPKRIIGHIDARPSIKKCLEYIVEMENRHEIATGMKNCPVNDTSNDIYTEPGDFPHMVGIGWNTIHGTLHFLCAGSLISSKFVLGAAHCKTSAKNPILVDKSPTKVRLGSKNMNDQISFTMKQRDVDILNFIVHPNYSTSKKYYDIALIELASEVTFTYLVQPACLWPHDDITQLGTKVNNTAWLINEETKRIYDNFEVMTVDIVANDKCNKILSSYQSRSFNGVKDHQLCSGKQIRSDCKDIITRDTGGPLQVRMPFSFNTQGQMHYVVGIASLGTSCRLPKIPDVYTRVSSFIDWIESIVWPTM